MCILKNNEKDEYGELWKKLKLIYSENIWRITNANLLFIDCDVINYLYDN